MTLKGNVMKDFEKDFETRIGYKFNNISLLRQALTHSSYANECKNKNIKDNERLEFLGDAVLELISSEFLFEKYPRKPEGELSKMRAALVCETALDEDALPIDMGEYLFLGRGEESTGGRRRASVVSDAVEAVIGAIYLDGGYESAKRFVDLFILHDIEKHMIFHDSKTILQEHTQSEGKGVPLYKELKSTGPDHNKTFYVEVFIDGKLEAKGEGHSKKAAQQLAAYRVLEKYGWNK